MPAQTALPSCPAVVILGGAHGSLALARSLGRTSVPVWYVSNDSPLTGWSRYVQGSVAWPGAEHADAVSFLRDFACSKGIEGALLIAASDADVKLVSQAMAELSAVYRIMLPEWERLQWLCDKPLLYRRAAELGLAFPETYDIPADAEAEAFPLAYPVILKPNMGGGNSRLARAKVIRADDPPQFGPIYREAIREAGPRNVVVQQWIPGGGEGQFSYAALWHDGRPVAEFTARRSRQYPVDFGFTSTFVETMPVPEAVAASRILLRSVSYSGLVEIEYKRDPRNGAFNILDVNTRPWSWFGLSAAAGVDLGRQMWDIANGRKPQTSLSARPACWMFLSRDLIAAATLMARGKLKPSGYLNALFNVRSWAAMAWRDPLPGLIELPLTAMRVFTRRVLDRSKSGKE